MPIFFHAESHLWIAYLFFLNGAMLSVLIRSWSQSYREITSTIEAQVLSAFFTSLLLNGVVLSLLEVGDFSFELAAYCLLSVSIVLLLVCVSAIVRGHALYLNCQWSVLRLVIYGMIFVVLFYNGGLIEQVSDAWWHMSLANKIAMANGFEPELGHLTGTNTRDYPSLWHANLALAREVSGVSCLWSHSQSIYRYTCYGIIYIITRNR